MKNSVSMFRFIKEMVKKLESYNLLSEYLYILKILTYEDFTEEDFSWEIENLTGYSAPIFFQKSYLYSYNDMMLDIRIIGLFILLLNKQNNRKEETYIVSDNFAKEKEIDSLVLLFLNSENFLLREKMNEFIYIEDIKFVDNYDFDCRKFY